MFFVTVLFAVSVMLLAVGAMQKDNAKVIFSLLAVATFGITIFWFAPRELGYGHVPLFARSLTDRLDKGIQYQMVTEDKEGDDEVLLVKKTVCAKSDCYRTVRTAEGNVPTSEFFMLDNDGNPIADNPYMAWPHPSAPTCGPFKPTFMPANE